MSKFMIPAKKSERAQSYVELALIIPVMLILVAGVVDLGRFFLAYMELRDAAQEGANYASIYTASTQYINLKNAVESRVRASASFPVNLTDTSTAKNGKPVISVDVDPKPANPATDPSGYCAGVSVVTVTVTYQFPIAGPYEPLISPNGIIPLNAVMKSMVLQPDC